ncbi:MAG: hypothetical protein LBF16_00240 [Pseudomonadales bacterium]|nr:hypothetical protein [Pseudomonadales bacterium]
MNREALEHLIRAAAAITNESELVIIGSQSILGAVPSAPEELLHSREADIYPLNNPDAIDMIDGAIGEDSPFDAHFGYYAQGVGPETAILPAGWKDRLVKIQNQNTDLKIGYCLAPIDLAASKLAAGREKDYLFVKAMICHSIIDADELREHARHLPVDAQGQARIASWIEMTKRSHDKAAPRNG